MLVGTVLAIAGCGGDGDDSDSNTAPDVAAMKTRFNELAAQAYDDAGKSRDDDYASGTTIDGCFAADDETIAAIGSAVGVEELTFTDEGFIQGVPEQEERLLCSVKQIEGEDGPPPVVNVGAGTTTLDRDQLLARLLSNSDDRHELEGEAEGLDPANVLAATGEGISQFLWVDDDFTIGVVGPTDKLSADQGFAALTTAVDGVSRTLSE